MRWIICRLSRLDKKEKTTISSINKLSIILSLSYEEMKKDRQRLTKVKPFINKYKWEGINIPSGKDDWKKIDKNNVAIVLNVLYAKKIHPAYVSKHNLNCEKQVIFLMVSNGEKRKAKSKGQQLWHYLAVKKLSTLLRGTMSKHYDDFYCLKCLHSLRTKNKLESHKKVCENK